MSRYEEISPSEFFYRNRDVAGFSNPVRATYQIVRELVENSLDACDAAGVLPDIRITLEGEGQEKPYVSVEYTIEVSDNGCGIPRRYIPSCFGKVFFGSKFRIRQHRGVFGLGGTMAILYGQITTGKPFRVISGVKGDSKKYFFEMKIDIERNKPIILDSKSIDKDPDWHGTLIRFSFLGNYAMSKDRILEYLKLTALANPHARIEFEAPDGDGVVFERAVNDPPKQTKEVLPHPAGVDVEIVRRAARASKAKNIVRFLETSFQCVGRKTALEIVKDARIDPNKSPRELNEHEIVSLTEAMTRRKYKAPSAKVLSPMGAELLKRSIERFLEPEFVRTLQRPPSSYSGHPFIVEAGIAYGGKIPEGGDIKIYRFANKVPLLYDRTAGVCWKVVSKIDWSRYRVSQGMPVAIFVHICSTKVPYKGVGKEAIGDRPEIEKEIELALRKLGRELSLFLGRKRREAIMQKRSGIMRKYLEKIAEFSTQLAEKEEQPDVEPLLEEITLSR